jgi:phage-related minor tail protein
MTQLLYPQPDAVVASRLASADVSDSPDGRVANAIAVEIVAAEGIGQAATKASGGTAQAR